jgi:hypothetical protein
LTDSIGTRRRVADSVVLQTTVGASRLCSVGGCVKSGRLPVHFAASTGLLGAMLVPLSDVDRDSQTGKL